MSTPPTGSVDGRTGRPRLVSVGLTVAATLAVILGALWLFQRRLIYFPAQALPPVEEVLPGAESVSFTTDDGISLGGWLLPVEDPTAPIVVVFNGNAGNRAGRAILAQGLADQGMAVLLFDYRGYGGNDGRPTEVGLLQDGRAARDYADLRWQGPVVYFGESLGSVVAVGVAVDAEPAAMVLRSPFPSLAAVGRVHYPFLPVGPMLWDDFDTTSWLEDLSVPVLVVVGSEDEVVPIELSDDLFDSITGPKTRVVIEGARHNDLALTSGEELLSAVAEFLPTALAG